MKDVHPIAPARGRLAVLLPGMGAVATTFLAGTLLVRRGLRAPVGSLAESSAFGAGGPLRRRVPLAELDDMVFGGWDIFPDDALAAARHAGVLEARDLDPVAEELAAIRPMPGAFYPEYVPRLNGTHLKSTRTKADMVKALRDDIRRFISDNGADRAVAVWCGSTERYVEPSPAHETIESFERGLRDNDPSITASQLYGWALLMEGVPLANGSPNFAVDFPAAAALAAERGVPVAGKDFKTGQTLVKTVLAPALKARRLGVHGWFSTNILGNRDGEVLDEPESFRSKEHSKIGVLEGILEPERFPSLYGDVHHKVRIEYYPPRGDDKEGWDNIDLFGWLGYRMQMKVNFLCKDSILAAPLVLDLALMLDLAQRAGHAGAQDWLGFFFKSPMALPNREVEHDLFAQQRRLEAAIKAMASSESVALLERVG